MQQIWKQIETPDEGKTGIVTHFHKKGLWENCRAMIMKIGPVENEQIKERMFKGMQCYGMNRNFLNNNMMQEKTQIKQYLQNSNKTNALETTTINKKDELRLEHSRNTNIENHLKPSIKEQEGKRLKTNNEIEDEMRGEIATRFAKSQSLKWAGHVMRKIQQK